MIVFASFYIQYMNKNEFWWFHKTEIENPTLSGNKKNRRQTNLFISFCKKVRVQKPKLNYTLENDNTVRIIMSTAVTRGPMFLKKYNSIAFSFLFIFVYELRFYTVNIYTMMSNAWEIFKNSKSIKPCI